jgi:hypothetical protein
VILAAGARASHAIVQRVRSRLFDAVLVVWTALFAPAALALALCGKPERAVRRTARAWAQGGRFTSSDGASA